MHRIQEMRVPYYERVCKFLSTSVKVHNETKVSGHFVVVGFHRRKGITIVWVRVDDYIHHLTQLGGLISVYGDWTGGTLYFIFPVARSSDNYRGSTIDCSYILTVSCCWWMSFSVKVWVRGLYCVTTQLT